MNPEKFYLKKDEITSVEKHYQLSTSQECSLFPNTGDS